MGEKKLMCACVVLGILAALGSIVARLVWKNIGLGSFLLVISVICLLLLIYWKIKRYDETDVSQRYKRKIEWDQIKGFIIYIGLIMVICGVIYYAHSLITNEPMSEYYEDRLVWVVLILYFLPLTLMNMKIAYKTRNEFFILSVIIGLPIFLGLVLFIFGVIGGEWIILLLFMMLFGGIFLIFMRKRYRVKEIDLYRNIVVKEGEKIDELLDGYSQRPYSRKIKIPVKDFKDTAKKFAHALTKEFVIFDYDIKENSAIYFPSTYFLGDAYAHFMMSADYFFNKKKFTRIKITKDHIAVFISKNDYDRILEPVSYHTLCQNVADKFEKSFLEFAKGNKENAIKILGGEGDG